MKQRPPQKIAPHLVDELRTERTDDPVSDSEMEMAAIAEALAPGREKLQSTEYGRFLALHYALLQNSRMTFVEFVRTRFIPEHVLSKGPAGQRHYHAILKHILKPETADALFVAEPTGAVKRLMAVPDWPYLDDVRLCEINTSHVQKIISAALEKGYSVQTVKHVRNVIGTVLTHAARRRYFTGDNPAFQIPLPPMTRRRKSM